MADDLDLLRLYVEGHSEKAFSDLVERHVQLVYSAAIRRLNGDGHAAQDVTQEVFRQLATHATELRRHPHLVGWLFKSTHFAAAKLVRTEARRRAREQEALTMHDPADASGNAVDWAQLRPLLDDEMLALGDDDREALLRRFFQGRKLVEIADALAISEDAARMRIERALERLRTRLARHKITSTAGALGVLLANNSVVAMPTGFATVVTAGALAKVGAAAATTSGVALFTMSKLTTGIAGLIAIGAITGLVMQQRDNDALRRGLTEAQNQNGELARLRQQNSALTAQLHSAQDRAAEFDRLRSDLAALKAQVASPRPTVAPRPPEEVRLIASLRNVGNATPAAALESLVWAKENLDVSAISRLIVLDGTARSEAEAILAQQPASERAKHGVNTPEDLVAFCLAGIGKPFTGFQVSEQTQRDADHVSVRVVVQLPQEGKGSRQFDLQHSATGWQWVIPAGLVHELPAELAKRWSENPGK